MASAQRLKLKQMPLDTWAIREKLCLAMSVQRSGDQNWVSVSRAIKPFGESDRPADWFSQKNCAAQYSDLLEKTETPKRKRGERVELETPGDLIVRKLTFDRIEELKKLLQQEKMQYKKLKRDIEMVKSGQADNRLHEISNEIKDQKRAEEIAAQELQKHYEEREIKINAHRLALKTVITPIKNRKTPVQQLKPLTMPMPGCLEEIGQPDTISPVRGPLSVEVNEEIPETHSTNPVALRANTPVLQPISRPSKDPSPRSLDPSPTSPLLSSLLKSPTPNPPGGPGPISPAVNSLFASVTGTTNSSKEIPVPHISPVGTKQLSSSPNSKFVSPTSTHPSLSPVSNNSQAVMSLFSGVTGSNPSNKISPKASQTSPSAGAPTLSKLLEMPPSVPGRLPPLPVIKTEVPEPVTPTIKIEEPAENVKPEEINVMESSKMTENISEADDKLIDEAIEVDKVDNVEPLSDISLSDEKSLQKSSVETSDIVSEAEKPVKLDNDQIDVIGKELQQITSTAKEKVSEDIPKNIKSEPEEDDDKEISLQELDDNKESQIETEESADETLLTIKEEQENEIKIETTNKTPERTGKAPKEDNQKEIEQHKGTDKKSKKSIQNDDDQESSTPVSKTTKSKLISSVRRGRRPRSRSRSSLTTEQPPAQDEESMSQESAPGTPDTSIPETVENVSTNIETSEDEQAHSTGGKISIPAVQAAIISDSVPNSPISHGDDPDSLKEFKLWKKSIMLVWRAAANHKFANVFLHPVTDDHAPGYSSVVLRPMDLSTIKKNIENGVIRTTMEFQHDMMLMFQNAILYNSSDQYVYKMAVEMQNEVMQQVQDYVATQLMVSTTEIKVLRGRGADSGKRNSTSEVSDFKETDQTKKRKSMQDDTKGKKKLHS